MTTITLESIKAEQTRLAAMIAQLRPSLQKSASRSTFQKF